MLRPPSRVQSKIVKGSACLIDAVVSMGLFRPAVTDVHVLAGNGLAAALGVFSKLASLHRGVLAVVCRARPCVDCDLHKLCLH